MIGTLVCLNETIHVHISHKIVNVNNDSEIITYNKNSSVRNKIASVSKIWVKVNANIISKFLYKKKKKTLLNYFFIFSSLFINYELI